MWLSRGGNGTDTDGGWGLGSGVFCFVILLTRCGFASSLMCVLWFFRVWAF